jgi:ERCC4-type nuclease
MVNIKMGYNSSNCLQELFEKKKTNIIFLSEKKNTTHTHTQKLKFNQSIPNNTVCDNTYNKHFKKYKKFKA